MDGLAHALAGDLLVCFGHFREASDLHKETKRERTGEGLRHGGRKSTGANERQMGDKAKWIQLIHAGFDKWHGDRERCLRYTHTHTYALFNADYRAQTHQ